MRRLTDEEFHALAKQRGIKWVGAGHPKCMELTDWNCPVGKDHKWPASYNSISRPKASGCPFCPSAGGSRKPSAKWNFAVIYPEYLEMWHWERNEKTPEEYLPRSNKAVWWKCQKSELHDWQASPNGMVGTKSIESKAKGCRYCRGLEVCADKSTGTPASEIVLKGRDTFRF